MSKKMKRKNLSIILAGIMTMSIGFTGCSNGSKEDISNIDQSRKTQVSSSEKKGKDMTLWTWQVAMTPGFEAAAKSFEEKTGNKITVEAFTPDDTYKQKVISAANSGDLPDIIHWWATTGLGFENVLVNLKDKVSEEDKSKFMAAAFTPCEVTQMNVDAWANDTDKSEVVKNLKAGDMYVMPADVGSFFTIYANNEILKEVGLNDQVPTDFETFIEYSTKVAEDTGKGGFVFAGGLADVYYNWMGRAIEAMWIGPEKSAELANRQLKMSNPEIIKPLKAFESLCTSGSLLNGSIAMSIDEADQAFAAGEAAYLLGGTFTYGQLSAMGMDVSNVYSFNVPAMKGSSVNNLELNGFTLTGMAIPQTSTSQDEAWEFIQYITMDPQGAVEFANGAYILPALKLGDASQNLSPTLLSMYETLSDNENVVAKTDAALEAGRRSEWGEFYKDMQKIQTGQLTAEQAAANFDKNVEEMIAAGK